MASDLKSSGKGGYTPARAAAAKAKAKVAQTKPKPRAKTKAPPRVAPTRAPRLRPATPIVTEHTRGQANAIDPHATPTPFQGRQGPTDHGGGHSGEAIGAFARLVATNLIGGALNPVGGIEGQKVLNRLYPHGTPGIAYQKKQTKQANLVDPAILKSIAGDTAKDFTDPHRIPYAALDVLSLASGAGKAVQVARAAKEAQTGARTAEAVAALSRRATAPDLVGQNSRLLGSPEGHRVLRHNGLEVQLPNVSPNAVTATGQHAFDRATELVPGLPGIGSKARVARGIRAQNQVRARRLAAPGIPLAEAAKKLRSVTGVTPRQMAYTVIARYGYDGAKGVALLDAEIAAKTKTLAKLTGQRRRKLEKRLDLLASAREHVRNPDTALTAALREGKALHEGHTEPSKIARGFVTAEGATKAKARHIHFTETGMTHEQYDALTDAQKALLEQHHADEMANLAGQSRKANRTAAQTSALRAKGATLNTRMVALRDQLAAENAKLGQMMHDGYVVAPKRATAASEAMPLVHQQDLVGRLQKQYDRAATAYMKHQSNGGGTAQRLGEEMAAEQARLHAAQEQAIVDHYAAINKIRPPEVRPGPRAFHTSDFSKPAGAKNAVRGVVGLNPKRAERSKQSTLTSFSLGREQVGPDVTLRDFQRETRHMDREARVRMAEKGSVPFDENLFDPNKHILIDTKAAARDNRGDTTKVAAQKRLAQAEDEDNALYDLSPWGQVQQALQEHLDWSKTVFREGDHATLAEAAADPLGFKMIDKKIGDAISGADVAQILKTNTAGRMLDFTNQISRGALIYLNPSYGPVQYAGNLGFLALQQGPWLGANLKRSSLALSKLSPEQLRAIDLEVGGGAAAALAHESSRQGMLQHVADVQNRIADQNPRRAAWIYEASRRGYKTPAEVDALLTHHRLERVKNEVGEAAQQAMVKFQRAPTLTRKYIGRAIFIFPWIEGSTRWVFRAALDRPLSSRAALEIRDRIGREQQKRLGLAKGATGGFIPYGHEANGMIPGVNLSSISPYGTGAGVFNAITGRGSPAAFAEMLQPPLRAAGEAATGLNFYTGHRYPDTMQTGSSFLPHGLAHAAGIFQKGMAGSSDKPSFPAGSIAVTALRGKPADETGVYKTEHGGIDAIKRIALGSTRPRKVVRANAEALSAKDIPPEKRAGRTVQQTRGHLLSEAIRLGLAKPGDRLNPELRKAFNLEQQRKVAYAAAAHGLKKGTPEYEYGQYEADMAFLAHTGRVSSAYAEQSIASVKERLTAIPNKEDQVGALQKLRRDLSNYYYYRKGDFGYTISQAKKQVRDKGGRGLD